MKLKDLFEKLEGCCTVQTEVDKNGIKSHYVIISGTKIQLKDEEDSFCEEFIEKITWLAKNTKPDYFFVSSNENLDNGIHDFDFKDGETVILDQKLQDIFMNDVLYTGTGCLVPDQKLQRKSILGKQNILGYDVIINFLHSENYEDKIPYNVFEIESIDLDIPIWSWGSKRIERFKYWNKDNKLAYGVAFIESDFDDYIEIVVTSLDEIKEEDILKVYDQITS